MREANSKIAAEHLTSVVLRRDRVFPFPSPALLHRAQTRGSKATRTSMREGLDRAPLPYHGRPLSVMEIIALLQLDTGGCAKKGHKRGDASCM